MQHIPSDLIPLPTMPYDQRPDNMPLDIEECRTAIWRTKGNVSEAAALLKTTSLRLRNFINNSWYLSRELNESKEQLVDIAESNVYDALVDEDPARRDVMTKFVLQTQGKHRGWGNGGGGKVSVNMNNSGPVQIVWGDGSTLSASDEKTIEGEVIDGRSGRKTRR